MGGKERGREEDGGGGGAAQGLGGVVSSELVLDMDSVSLWGGSGRPPRDTLML